MDRLKQDLRNGPLTRDGFDEQLRGKIEKKLDEGRAPTRRGRPMWLSRAAVALAALILLSVAVYRLPDIIQQQNAAHDATGQAAAGKGIGDAGAAADPGVRSALLIGLRQDREGAGSTYRTVFLAPDGETLREYAEGEGLLVPVRQKFWRVEPSGGNGASGLLTAYPAETPQKKAAASPAGVSEKVLFVGNQYIAVQQTGQDGVAHDWVKEIRQLQTARSPKAAGTAAEPHVPLLISGDEPASVADGSATGPGDRLVPEWTVVRQPGAWSLAEAAAGVVSPQLTPIPNTPDSKIVNDDEVTVSWDVVKDFQPAAADVFSSRTGDMAVVVTDRNLVAYGVRNETLEGPEATVPLRPGETVVMAQWALTQNGAIDYVADWIKRVVPLLQSDRPKA